MTARLLNLPADQYHADAVGDTPTLSASIAKTLVALSPMHAWAEHPRLNPNFERKTEDKFDIANAVHHLLLEGLDVMEVLAFPNYTTNAAKEAREIARSHGRIPVLTHHATAVTQMTNAVAAQLAKLNIDPVPLTDGTPEQTIVWDEDGVACRCRVDWLRNDYTQIHDVKTTSRVGHPSGWAQKTLYDTGCDLQAAAYIRAVRAATGVTPEFRWVLIEKTPPYAVSVIAPEASVLAIGEDKWERALALWRECLRTDEWPAYGTELHWAELPVWVESRWLERQAEEAAA